LWPTAETFVDCDSRRMFHNAVEFAVLNPGEDAPRWAFCAPRLDDDPKVEAVRRRLALRVGITVATGPLRGWLDNCGGRAGPRLGPRCREFGHAGAGRGRRRRGQVPTNSDHQAISRLAPPTPTDHMSGPRDLLFTGS
jgi:hypothetical protein